MLEGNKNTNYKLQITRSEKMKIENRIQKAEVGNRPVSVARPDSVTMPMAFRHSPSVFGHLTSENIKRKTQ